MELFFIQNAHPWGLHISYLIKRLFPLKPAQFINLPLESINFVLFYMWTCHNALMVLKKLFFNRVQIGSYGVFGSILMRCNSDGWFLVGHTIFGLIVSVTSSNLFCSPLWKVVAFFGSIFGYSSHFELLTWPTLAFFCKTCSSIFFILLVNNVGIL